MDFFIRRVADNAPYLQFPFECPWAGKAACPQAVAKNLHLSPTRCGHALDPTFSLLGSLPFKRPADSQTDSTPVRTDRWIQTNRS